MIVVDTPVLIEILDKRSKLGEEALRKVIESDERPATTAINLHELLYGLGGRSAVTNDLARLATLEFAERDAELSSRIKLNMEKQGSPIPRLDAMVAAVTIRSSGKLFTFDQKHVNSLQSFGLKLFR